MIFYGINNKYDVEDNDDDNSDNNNGDYNSNDDYKIFTLKMMIKMMTTFSQNDSNNDRY